MSTILDALKKSEQERKLNNIPTLSDMPAPEESARFSLLWVIIGLAMVVILLLVIILLWNSRGASELVAQPALKAEVGPTSVVPTQDQIEVNVVSWAEDADLRFVVINGKMVRENEFAAPGLKVLEIKRDSVVVNFRGKRIERKP